MIENFNFKKKFGQNFISDGNLLENIVKFSEITENDTVVEVGTGAGALTEKLCEKADFVFSFEIDTELKEFLDDKFKNTKNIQIIFDDVMNYPNEKINEIAKKPFHLVANLPYYITTPLIFKFLENPNCKSLTIMTQKEVAQRIISKEGSKDFGITSVTIGAVANAKICKIIPKEMFTPMPKVDSAVVKITKIENDVNYAVFKSIVQKAFSMRRKTLQNNLTNGLMTKEQFLTVCEETKISPSVRAEQISIEKFKEICSCFEKLNKNN